MLVDLAGFEEAQKVWKEAMRDAARMRTAEGRESYAAIAQAAATMALACAQERN